MSFTRPLAGVVALAVIATPALANNLGENYAWQFQTTADKVNLAAIQDMIQKRRNGYYAAPVYTTNIESQYNCNVSSTAQGNQGTNSTVANSPTTSGNGASAIGTNNSTDIDSAGAGSSGADSDQANNGDVGSSVRGSTSASVHGWADQALNSTQTNSGDQTATVNDSSACIFAGALN